MTLFGFTLVLVAAVCHATWNFFVKRVNAGPELIWMFSALAAVLYAPMAIYIWMQTPEFSQTQMLFIVGSSLLHLGYFLLLQLGYRKGDLSLVYPTARSTGPLLSTSFAVLLLGETLTLQIALGGAIIIFGVLMLTGGLRRVSGNVTLSVGFGVSAGFLIGSYTAWDAYAVSTLVIPPLLLDYASSICRSTLLAPVAYERWGKVQEIWREYRREVIIIAILNPLAYILVLVALTFTPVVFVAPVRELSVLLTVLMGSILLREGNLKHRLIWAGVILIGLTVLASSP